MDLTDRQVKIIKAVVEEYSNTGQPVGSQTLDKKYQLGVSPATIRNEMAELMEKGFLVKPHTSAGRIPTSTGIKFYVNELLKEKELSVAEEVAIKERIWDLRFKPQSLLQEATKVLSERAQALSLAATEKGQTFHAGYSFLLNEPEFYDIDLFRQILILLDEQERILDMFNQAAGQDPIHLLLGEELGHKQLQPVGCVFADIQIGSTRGSIGVLSANRQPYEQNIPLVRYIANLVNQIAQT